MAKSPHMKTAAAAAKKYGIPVQLFYSLIDHESGWQAKVTSSAGAIGLTQLMPGTARGMKVDPWNPRQNLFGGAKYLAAMYKRFGNWKDALRAYNVGPNGIADPHPGLEYAHSVLKGAKSYPAQPQPVSKTPGPSRPKLSSSDGSMFDASFVRQLWHDDPEFADWLVATDPGRKVDIPDNVAQRAGLVSPGGSVETLPLARGAARQAIAAAASQLGKPYVFGSGPDTSSFDCSDLIQWAYKQMGVSIPRTTFDQIKAGVGVSWNDLKPGDLIFPTNHHVVMYVGNGKVIAAPHTGTVVQYQPLSNFRNPVAIRRVVR